MPAQKNNRYILHPNQIKFDLSWLSVASSLHPMAKYSDFSPFSSHRHEWKYSTHITTTPETVLHTWFYTPCSFFLSDYLWKLNYWVIQLHMFYTFFASLGQNWNTQQNPSLLMDIEDTTLECKFHFFFYIRSNVHI